MKIPNTKTLFAALVVVILTTACSRNDPQHHITSAKDYLQKNDPKAATIQLKNALEINPELGEARFLLGTILLKSGDAAGSEIEFRKALAAKHPEVLVVPQLARSMLILGQTKKLIDEFGSTQLDQPAAVASLQTSLAIAYAAVAMPAQAEAALAAALQSDANYAPALLLKARQKAAERDIDSALQTTEAVIARDPVDADAWKFKGDLLLYGKGKPDEALASFRKSVEVRPEFLAGHSAAVTLLIQQRKFDDAAKQLEQLKKVAPQSLQATYFEALLTFQKRDYKLARELTQQLLRIAPDSALALQLAGAAELQLNSLVQAQAHLEKAVRLAPNLTRARQLLIATYLRSGQSAKALTALNAAAGKDGPGPRLYLLAGEVHLQNGDAKKAEEYFTKALKMDPTDARKRTALAMTQLALGKTETGLDELQDVAASDNGTAADLGVISVHLRRKDFAKALLAIDQLEKKQPNQPMAANLRGRVQLAQKDEAGARKSFERALAIDPSYFGAAASLASMDLAVKNPADAKKRFESLLVRNPKDGRALLAMAQLAATQGAPKEELVALLTKAVDADPTDVAPRLLLTELYMRSNDNKQALAAAQNAVSAVPGSPELLSTLGRVQQMSGDVEQAIASYKKLVAMQPLSPQPHTLLAEAQLANKDGQGARQSLRKALEVQPDHLDAQRALLLLDMKAQKFPDALKTARTVQQQRPNSSLGFAFEGDIAYAQKSWASAEAAYRTALRRAAPPPDTAVKLQAVLLLSGKKPEADAFASSWLKAHPKDVAFLAYQGELALRRKDYAAAEKFFNGVLESQPDNAGAINNLAWVTGQLGKNGGLELAEKANNLAPNQPVFIDTLAMLLAEKNEFARAIELQTKALGLQPSDAGLRLNLAKIYLKSGDKVRARTELEALSKLGDSFRSQPEVNALLKSL